MHGGGWTILIVIFTMLPTFSGCEDSKMTADLILVGGKISTVDAARPLAEALAVRDGRIFAVGTDADIRSLADEHTEIIEAAGRRVLPGLIESHAHFLSLGQAQMRLDLMGTESAEAIAAMVRKRASELTPGRWIRGRGWDQNDWPVKRFPTHEILDEAAPDHPVYLTRVDGHAAWVNEKALELAGLTADTRDPEGGRLIRDDADRPTGVLIDNAMELVNRLLPPLDRDQLRAALIAAQRRCFACGITSFHDMGAGRGPHRFDERPLRGGGVDPSPQCAPRRGGRGVAHALLRSGADVGRP